VVYILYSFRQYINLATIHIIITFEIIFNFFFQAEDGIRARNVTGVQSCALPISNIGLLGHSEGGLIASMVASKSTDVAFLVLLEIGRASCRERFYVLVLTLGLTRNNIRSYDRFNNCY